MILILLILSSCRTLFPPQIEEKTISTVQSWAYQLQNIDLSTLERSTYDLLVIDYSKDGTEGGKWSSSEIRRVKDAGEGKILLAYLSIGEAETHRSYWDNSWVPGNPPWVGREAITSDGRPTRFHVKYWDSEWKDILRKLVDSMISQGFSGVLLDGCDEYAYWSESLNGESEVLSRQDAADRMVALITELSRYARNRAKEFIVFTQGRTKLLTATIDKELYLNTIQGVIAPEIFFPGEELIDNLYAPQSDLVEYFKDIRSRGKVVCSLEYLSQTNTNLDRYFREAKTLGFLPYAANRSLDTLRFP